MPIVRILLVVLALASPLSMAGGAVAGPLGDAQAAHGKRDYATALRLWRPLADRGNAEAQYALGSMYADGHGAPQNNAEAAKWWRLAADQGNTFAQYNLGTLYDDGKGVPQNKAEALKLYRLAAERGNDGAPFSVGVLYFAGVAVPENRIEAAKWFRRAADQGHVGAQVYLALSYATGLGVPQDNVQAYMWLSVAADENCHSVSTTSIRRTPWNKGKLIGAKPPLRPNQVWSIRTRLLLEGRVRDLALFNLAIDSKLRGCDVVALRVEDVAPSGNTLDRATVRQKKTGRPVKFELTDQTRQAVDDYLKAASKRRGEDLFNGRLGPSRAMTTRQYARLLGDWIASIGLDAKVFGTHSLRRTTATLIYRRTGNLRAVQLLRGHTKIESTVRYLGIEVDDALSIAEQVEV